MGPDQWANQGVARVQLIARVSTSHRVRQPAHVGSQIQLLEDPRLDLAGD